MNRRSAMNNSGNSLYSTERRAEEADVPEKKVETKKNVSDKNKKGKGAAQPEEPIKKDIPGA